MREKITTNQHRSAKSIESHLSHIENITNQFYKYKYYPIVIVENFINASLIITLLDNHKNAITCKITYNPTR